MLLSVSSVTASLDTEKQVKGKRKTSERERKKNFHILAVICTGKNGSSITIIITMSLALATGSRNGLN